MQNSMDELSQRMSLLSDESLREIAEGSREDYEEYAVDLARKELESRQILKSPVLSTFKDLILSVSFDEAKEDIILKFPEKMPHIDALREVFDTLHATQTSGHNSDFLHIKTDETSSIALGEDAQTGERYGVEFCSWAEWLSFRLKPGQVTDTGPAAYGAVCLATLTTRIYRTGDTGTAAGCGRYKYFREYC